MRARLWRRSRSSLRVSTTAAATFLLAVAASRRVPQLSQTHFFRRIVSCDAFASQLVSMRRRALSDLTPLNWRFACAMTTAAATVAAVYRRARLLLRKNATAAAARCLLFVLDEQASAVIVGSRRRRWRRLLLLRARARATWPPQYFFKQTLAAPPPFINVKVLCSIFLRAQVLNFERLRASDQDARGEIITEEKKSRYS